MAWCVATTLETVVSDAVELVHGAWKTTVVEVMADEQPRKSQEKPLFAVIWSATRQTGVVFGGAYLWQHTSVYTL